MAYADCLVAMISHSPFPVQIRSVDRAEYAGSFQLPSTPGHAAEIEVPEHFRQPISTDRRTLPPHCLIERPYLSPVVIAGEQLIGAAAVIMLTGGSGRNPPRPFQRHMIGSNWPVCSGRRSLPRHQDLREGSASEPANRAPFARRVAQRSPASTPPGERSVAKAITAREVAGRTKAIAGTAAPASPRHDGPFASKVA